MPRKISKSKFIEKIEQSEIIQTHFIELPEIFELFSKPYLIDDQERFIIDHRVKEIPFEFFKKSKKKNKLKQITYNSIESHFEEFQDILVRELEKFSLNDLQ